MKKLLRKAAALLLVLWFGASCAVAQDYGSVRIYFGENDSLLNIAATKVLDSLISKKVLYPGRRFSVIAQAFEEISPTLNHQLALIRAKAVDTYLSQRGIRSLRLVPACTATGRNAGKAAGREHNYVHLLLHTGFGDSQNAVATSIDTTPINSTFTLSNLLFIDGKDTLLPKSLPVLKELVAAMNKNARLSIRLEGHVCCGAKDAAGIDLSKRRAAAVADFLQAEGIAASRLQTEGFGFLRPLYFPEKNAEDKAANRRVEVRIVAR